MTYENVQDSRTIDDQQYEPIEPQPVNQCYENVDQPNYENVDQPKYENLDEQASYENLTQQPSYENLDDQPGYENLIHQQPSYENLDQGQTTSDKQPSYENLEQTSYENVGNEVISSSEHQIEVDNGDVYENVNLGQSSARKALELVNVYEDVIPPPPKTTETEEVIYNQVKVLRRSIQEVNELLRQDPSSILDVDVSPATPKSSTSPVVDQSSSTVSSKPPKTEENEALKKKQSIAKDGRETAKLEYVIRDIAVDEPSKDILPSNGGVRLSLSPKRMSSEVKSTPSANDEGQSQLSLSLPSLLNSPNKAVQSSKIINHKSLPPTPVHHAEPETAALRPESDSVSSKRRFESEIGRDLLRERRIRNEIESSRLTTGSGVPSRRQSTPESPASKLLPGGKPALPVKMNPKSKSTTVPPKQLEVMLRPTTLETSFDYEPLRRASSPPSSGSPLSPVSPSSEGRNFSTSGVRKTSVKELLNKFQTGGVVSETNSNDRSAQRGVITSTPTSPIKPAMSAVSSALEEISPPKKAVVKDKENIEVVLSPSPKSPICSTDSSDAYVDNSTESSRDSSLEDTNNKEILRQKPLPVALDMSDPKTRLRIERYKEERRSFLREKYKSESFRSEGKDDAVIVRLKQKAGSPTQGAPAVPPPPSLQSPEPGLIDEDVNVKERAAQWSAPLPKTVSPIHASGNPRSCSEAVTIAATPQQKRIRDMAAMFEKESP